ncbi:MAG TPA: hypothetical protein VG268_06280 [Streptosporangiaceae bacterium]|nr:hypothetical protein [Streptosporangiaceae bacterium]
MPEQVSAPGPGEPLPADPRAVMEGIQSLHQRIAGLEKLLVMGSEAVAPELRRTLGPEFRKAFVPAWRRRTKGEPRWHIVVAVTAAMFLQTPLPGRLVLFRPTWLLPVLEVALLVGLVGLDRQYRIDRESKVLRGLSMVATGFLSAANAWSAVHLIMGLINGTEGNSAGPLLASGAVIWLTNVIVFSWWYWELDRGGPAARAHGTKQCPDFMFPQMTSPELAPPDWEPMYLDYAYLAFTNATAFSPTDVMPMTRWAKATMALQSIVSIVVVALVVARAVNVLK